MPRIFLCAALALVLLAPGAFAQSIMGTLTGTVLDGSGAVVPGASVTLRNENSGDARKSVTNAEGFFNFSSVPAGTYALQVEMQGFAKWARTGIPLNANDRRNVNVSLEIGASSQQVEVSVAADTLAVVDSGEKSSLVTSSQLQNLSIVGRNAAEYVKILPGATMIGNNGENRPGVTGEVVGINGTGISGRQGGLSGVMVNGANADITSDGAHTTDPGTNGATPVNPNADMIQELRVMTSNFGAENAIGPVVVNSVSKSGGQTFHGTGYLYARNPIFNANDWENNYVAQYRNGKHIDNKPDSKYWYPGGNIGGPVLIPGTNFNKNRDKLFFFTGFEYYKQQLDSGVMRAYVPSADQRKGDFSKPDPLARGAGGRETNFPGGIVPANMIDPGGKALLNLYPMPNADPATNDGFNYTGLLSVAQNSYQSLTRVDYSISDSAKLFVRYNRQREQQNQPTGIWGARGGDWVVPSPSNIVGDNRSDALATSLTNVFSPTMTNEVVFGYTFIDFPNYPEDPSKLERSELGFPYKGVFGQAHIVPQIASWTSSIPNLGSIGGYNPRLFATKNLWNVSDNVAKVVGTHTLKFGGYLEQVINKQIEWNQDNGTLVYAGFNGSPTGNMFADLLTGQGYDAYQEDSINPPNDQAYWVYSFYGQDNWKATRRLTLEFGVRLEHLGAHYTRNDIGMAVFDPSKYNPNASVMEHSGLSWYAIDKSLPKSGRTTKLFYASPRFGFAYDVFGTGRTVLRGGIGMFRGQENLSGYAGAVTVGRGGKSYGCNGASCPPFFRDLDTAQYTSGGITSLAGVADLADDQMPLTTSYSFTVNQRLPASFMLEAAYVGNKGKYVRGTPNINAVPLGAALGTGDGNQDHFRPFRTYQNITLISHFLTSDYNALQTSLSRQAGPYTLAVNYTWSKLTGNRGLDGGLPDRGVAWRHGVLQGHRPHALNFAYSVTLPNHAKGNPFVKGLVNGWEISGISQFQSGAELATNANSISFNAGAGLNAFNVLGTNDVTLFPRMICDPKSGLAKGQYINGACFARAPADGSLGDGAFPYLGGPMFMNHDLSVFKNFSLTEHKKLEFRVSAFNFLNHPLVSFRDNDNNLDLNFDANGKAQPRFGYADYKYGHRVMQLAVKFLF